MYPYWFMSSPTTGLNGKIARLHVWDKAVDDRVIKQMARTGGTNFFQSFAHFPKASDYTPVGNVVEQEGSLISAVSKFFLIYCYLYYQRISIKICLPHDYCQNCHLPNRDTFLIQRSRQFA